MILAIPLPIPLNTPVAPSSLPNCIGYLTISVKPS